MNSINVNGCSVCQPGKENYTTYNTRLRGKRVRMYQYDYRTESGELFACCAPTLEACRERRDKWLDAKKKISMLTIEIPKSNRRKSEEDALASFILSEIKEKGECVYFHYGVGWGNNWPHCWAKNTGSDAKDRHQISELAHDNVIRAFIDKGYSVEYRSEIAAGRYVIIRG